MKILGMVNKYNRGIAKANKELERNGNPKAQFDVNKLTEFRVTIVANGKSGTMNDESGTMIDYAKVAKNTEIRVENSQLDNESGTMNGESGTMILEKAKLYDIQSQDDAVFAVVADSPGIKKDQIFLRVQTSIRSVQRTLDRLAKANKIEYRGSKQKGGWFVKT